MLILNFAHPLTANYIAAGEALVGQGVERVVERPVQFEVALPFVAQVVTLVEGIGLSSVEWQTVPMIVNLPALNYIAAALLAELHGRMG